MTIVLLVEGDTEAALKRHLKTFLDRRAEQAGQGKVRLQTRDIVNVKPHKFERRVAMELSKSSVTAVVGLIDVFPKFKHADEAKAHLLDAAGNHPGFHAHAAQYDVEAWLLAYWHEICKGLGLRRQPPGGNPEQVDDIKPPAYRLKELYRQAKPRPRKYAKITEMF
jgi:hypothetical protein